MFKYKGKIMESIEDFPAETFGFVYQTTHKSGKAYIGKKVLYFNRKVKLGKRELLALPPTRGRRATTKQVVKESDWKDYYGSHMEIKNMTTIVVFPVTFLNHLFCCGSSTSCG